VVRTAYIDTSSFLRALVSDADGHKAAKALVADPSLRLVSSQLLAIEAARAAIRLRNDAPTMTQLADDVAVALARVNLVAIDGAVVAAASALPETVKTLDAIHVATAELLGDALDYAITDDARMAAVLRAHGVLAKTATQAAEELAQPSAARAPNGPR
jgi:predicted nucleic acid-binding protein